MGGFFARTKRQPESGKLGKPDFNIVNVSDGVVLEKIQDNDSRADALKNEPRENDGDHHNTPRDSSNRNEGEDEQPFTEDFMKLFGLCANMNQLKQDVDISQKIQSLENVVYVSLILNTSLWVMSGMIFYASHV